MQSPVKTRSRRTEEVITFNPIRLSIPGIGEWEGVIDALDRKGASLWLIRAPEEPCYGESFGVSPSSGKIRHARGDQEPLDCSLLGFSQDSDGVIAYATVLFRPNQKQNSAIHWIELLW